MKELIKHSWFASPIYLVKETEFLEDCLTNTEAYIFNAKQKILSETKGNTFGKSYHSTTLIGDKKFLPLQKKAMDLATTILKDQQYSIDLYNLYISEMWVQEFSEQGGGHHSIHTHWNGHISGFYFLKCSENTSFPHFHDPRPGKEMSLLPAVEKNISDASSEVYYKPTPGTMMLFNSYLPHSFSIDQGKEPFRFIHFNIQAFPNELQQKEI
jgi:uncharacterized protein (TIGR02466 family)